MSWPNVKKVGLRPDQAAEAINGAEDFRVCDVGAICDWLVAEIALRLEIPAKEINSGTAFASMGIDSVTGVMLSRDLGERLGRSLPPTLIFDYPSIAVVAGVLAKSLAQEARRRSPLFLAPAPSSLVGEINH